MGKAGVARKIAAVAALGGGGLSFMGASLYGVLRAEAELARRTIGNADGEPPDATGWYGHGRPGPALKMVLLGDSSMAGYGVDTVQDTPGAHLASGLAEGADRRVYVRSLAYVGAQSRDLAAQVDKAIAVEPHVAVILVGVNDITHTRLLSESVRELASAVTRLREAGADVVVGTCPDLGTIEPIAPPLRQLARAWSRRLAAAQTVAVVDSGGRTVSLGSVLGPEF
ncbi:MAG: SGNH/GDSL hydrolase family protein, partial [Nocardioidaceae bacterium]|nr:SGNH/GDSL hydrolase family protein [Nocardioidaceae bacterium]